MVKVISFYLPQFHSIPENDAVWGKGFTEWNNVKSAIPLIENQNQPRVPLNNNYYNLLDEETIKWQTDLAKKNKIYGFCIYHYWFSDKLLLNKPLELIRDSKKIHFPYCICWANESWTDAWVATDKPKSFLKQEYGDVAEWKRHFDYLLSFFRDPDYIVENNKPLLVIYRPESINDLNERLDLWNELAKKNGFSGITFAYQQLDFELDPQSDDSRFKYSIEYQPKYAQYDLNQEKITGMSSYLEGIKGRLKYKLQNVKTKYHVDLLAHRHNKQKKMAEKMGPNIQKYGDVCEKIINKKPRNNKSVAGMFVGYDDTPRKGRRGLVIQSNPELFKKYLDLQMTNIEKNYSNDFLFLFAWNEWAEGGYLEPDSKYGFEYLEAVKETVNKHGLPMADE